MVIISYYIYLCKTFLNSLQIIYIYLHLFPLFLQSQRKSSFCGILISIASSPIHSILFHGMMYSSFFEKSENPHSIGTINDNICPQSRSISSSHAYPSLSPPHRLITSSSLSSTVLIFRIVTLQSKNTGRQKSRPFGTIICKQVMLFSFSLQENLI